LYLIAYPEALALSPLFIVLEVLFPLGYKQELQVRIIKIASQDVRETHQ